MTGMAEPVDSIFGVALPLARPYRSATTVEKGYTVAPLPAPLEEVLVVLVAAVDVPAAESAP